MGVGPVVSYFNLASITAGPACRLASSYTSDVPTIDLSVSDDNILRQTLCPHTRDVLHLGVVQHSEPHSVDGLASSAVDLID